MLSSFLLPCLEVNHLVTVWVILYENSVWLHWQKRLKVTYLESWIVVRTFNALECSLIFVAARNFSVLWHFYYAKNSKVFWNFEYVGCSNLEFSQRPVLPGKKLNITDHWISQFDERARSRLWIIWNESAENKILKSQNPSIFRFGFTNFPIETVWNRLNGFSLIEGS